MSVVKHLLFKIKKYYHNNNGDIMIKASDYYYKGYDIENINRLEKLFMEYNNPYGYNFDCNMRRVVDYNKKATHTNQDWVKLQPRNK